MNDLVAPSTIMAQLQDAVKEERTVEIEYDGAWIAVTQFGFVPAGLAPSPLYAARPDMAEPVYFTRYRISDAR